MVANKRARRWSDEKIAALATKFEEHILHDAAWKQIAAEYKRAFDDLAATVSRIDVDYKKTSGDLATVVNKIAEQMPAVNDVVTRWTQAKGIFWFLTVISAIITGMFVWINGIYKFVQNLSS